MAKVNSSQVNHVYFVVDRSGSMMMHAKNVKNVCNALISETGDLIPGVENRVSIYTFNNLTSRDLTDGDPRFASFDSFSPNGGTAINDALQMVLEDIQALRRRVDNRDRTFLVYLVTDGEDNSSRVDVSTVNFSIRTLSDVVTVAAFVPNSFGEKYAQRLGIHPGNVQIWDVTQDFAKVKDTVTSSMREYATIRSTGAKTSTGLFRPNVMEVQKAVNSGSLAEFTQPLVTLDVTHESEIEPFVKSKLGIYVKGTAYYELTKSEQLGPTKNLLIRHNVSGKVYHGPNARAILGVPSGTTRISVDRSSNAPWKVFVQSTSVNRILKPNTQLIVIK